MAESRTRTLLALAFVAIVLGVIALSMVIGSTYFRAAEELLTDRWRTGTLVVLITGAVGAFWQWWRLTRPLLSRLNHAESLSSSVLNVLVDGIIVIDTSGQIRLFSPAAERMFGYSRQEVLGQNVKMLMPEPQASAHDSYVRRYLQVRGQRPIGVGRVVRALRKDGETFPVRISLGELHTQHDHLFVGIVSDVTSQQAAERKIMQLAKAIEASADAVYVTDRQGLIEFVNPAFTVLTGIDREHAIGLSPRSIESELMPAAIRREMWEMLERGEAWRGRVLNRRLGTGVATNLPETYWVDTTIAPIRDEPEGVVGYVSVQQDITELVQREESDAIAQESAELRARVGIIMHAQKPLQEKLGETLDSLLAMRGLTLQQKGGVFLLAADGQCLEMSVLKGNFSEEFIRREKCIPLGVCLCGRVAASGEVLVSDDCFCDPRHEHRYSDMEIHGHYIVPLRNSEHVLGVLFLYTDPYPIRADSRLEMLRLIGEMIGLAIANDHVRNQLIAARDAALEAARVKSQFLANMSHEIRTPMNGVLGMLDLLRDSELSRQNTQFVETAYQSALSLLKILNDILDYSKIESGKLDIEQIDFDLQELVGDIGAIFAERASRQNVELICYTDPALPRMLQGDPTRLRQVLVNLIGNALKFTEKGEVALKVTGCCTAEGPVNLCLTVTDSGIGISADVQARLFQSFVQADNSTTRKYGGTGLGLAICKQLVELMGGQLAVESESGVGSRFWFTLTLEPGSKHLPRITTAKEDKSLQGFRILVVDDNATNRQILEHYLKSWSIEQDAAENAASGMKKLHEAFAESHPFAAAIIDMAMPGMNGLDLARLIKTDPVVSNTRLLMLSSIGMGTGETLQAGIERCLMKPVRQSALFDALIGMLGPTLVHQERETVTHENPCFAGTVLLVEDNRVNQVVVSQWLARFGIRPDIANNGREAMEQVRRGNYDLIFMDCQMPEMDGYESTQLIRRYESSEGMRRHPIVAMTAGAMPEDRELCRRAGMDDYVTKPLTREVLVGTLEKWLVPAAVKKLLPSKSSAALHSNQSVGEQSID